MLFYDRADVSEGVNVNKTSESKECDICHHCCFLDNGFNFQFQVCNGCHGLLMVSISLSNIALLNIKGSDYCCINGGISKSEAINLMKNINLTTKKQNIIKYKNLLSHIKMGKKI